MGKTVVLMLLQSLLWTTVWELSIALELNNNRREHIYSGCPRVSTLAGQVLDSGHVRSSLACFSWCSSTEGCAGATVCSEERVGLNGKEANCTLFADLGVDGCGEVIDAEDPGRCFSARKQTMEIKTEAEVGITTEAEVGITTEAEVETTTSICQNGGHLNGRQCVCTSQYGGLTCERLIRDCSEPYNRGFKSPDHDGVYSILPVGAPSPFQVKCVLAWGGATYPFTKTSMSMPNTWSALKNGFGDNLTLTPTSKNYFVGLDNLHYLTAQGYYSMQFRMTNPGVCAVFYDPVVIGNESSSYRLTNSNFFTEPGQPSAEDLFESAQAPIRISTSDRNNGCTQASATAGWYDVNCVRFSPFADVIQWPTDGGVLNFSEVKFVLVRLGDVVDGSG
ncbi:hypothetical protein V1264_006735 [Littorina saxatilis]|uniref:Fibrinogen C-terminal domain-containing protein n=1 Tax=Littorina saxatilis TaxID=31220 RepID=A0AAN9AY24_9CAEN